jgi:dolichyldiphosphatase
MPSSHTQLMFFFTVYVALWLYRTSTRPLPSSSSSSSHHTHHHQLHTHCDHALYKPLSIAICLLLSLAVAASRVILGVHSIEQVIAGAVAGVCCAVVWHALGNGCVRPLYRWAEDTKIAKLFLLRDSSDIPNVMRHEYELHRRHRPPPIFKLHSASQPDTKRQ